MWGRSLDRAPRAAGLAKAMAIRLKHWMAGRIAEALRGAPAAAVAIAALPVAAHHSNASYDGTRSILLHGTLLHATVANPHTRFEIAVPGEGGAVTWVVETGGKGYVLRAIGGVLRDQFAPGQAVSVTLHPRRDGTLNGLLMEIRFPDGRVLEGIPLP